MARVRAHPRHVSPEESSGQGQRVLVTGGAGFIGRCVVRTLRQAGHEVVVADLKRCPEAPRDAVVGDLCEDEVRRRAVTPGVDAIVHLAAETSVLGSIRDPALVHETNVEMTAALLELARELGVGTFVLASTNAVVGPREDTIVEDVPLAPLTPYGATKAACEMLMSGYAGSFGMRAVALRLTNVYGVGMGLKDSFVARLMRAASHDEGVRIYGDGHQRRDLVDVRDAADAVVAAVGSWPSGPVIVGGGRSFSVLEMVETARQTTGRAIPTTHVEAQPGEMPAVVVDISRARDRGWEPTISLPDGMHEAWADFRTDFRTGRP